jgi:hypothetical protein
VRVTIGLKIRVPLNFSFNSEGMLEGLVKETTFK